MLIRIKKARTNLALRRMAPDHILLHKSAKKVRQRFAGRILHTLQDEIKSIARAIFTPDQSLSM